MFYDLFCYILGMLGWGGVGWGGGVSCFHGHLNKCPLGDLNKSPWENYLEGGGSEEIIKSTRFCKVRYVLNSDIKYSCPVLSPLSLNLYDIPAPSPPLCLSTYMISLPLPLPSVSQPI